MPHHSRIKLVLALGVAGSLLQSVGHAQTIVKPEFLLMVDTSGSMTSSAPANSCGYAPANRINAAACVVRNIADGVGDAIFGLGTFNFTCGGAVGSAHYSSTTNGSCGNCGDTATNVAGYTFPFLGCTDSSRVVVNIAEANQWDMRTWGDGTWTSCAIPSGLSAPALGGNELANNYAGSGNGLAISSTPLAGMLHVSWRYLTHQLAGETPSRPSPYRNFNGGTGIDPYARCRPVNVIMLTDGGESCVSGGATPAANNARNIGCLRFDVNNDGTVSATESNNDLNGDGDCYDTVGGVVEQDSFRTRVYPIYFGAQPGTAGVAAIETMAAGGGVPAHPVNTSGGSRSLLGYYGSNESEISDAISDIIAGSRLVELCNGIDDDCDGMIDEDFNLGAACTTSTMACSNAGVFVCHPTDQTQAICNATAPVPGTETTQAQCTDGRDNDCDGATDCADPNCATQSFCMSCTPTAEVCDGRDNDCDGLIDEGGITRPCGSMIGVCTAGTQTCQQQSTMQPAGTWGACTGNTGGPETCDGLDNNCNGVADEGLTRACGSMVGQCRPGVQLCLGAGGFGGTCVGQVGPTTEVCDGIDNDCDGMTDEGIASPGSCGVAGVGICTSGTIQCTGGRFQCMGGTTARPETCNGLDDDCNGVVDDGLAAGGTCQPMGTMIPVNAMGMAVGACRLGALICRAGATVCDGAIGPTTEVCDGIDNDCDGMTDEGLDGTACGMTMGACRAGMRRCVMGRDVCDGAVGPTAEVCDGVDNDCDGETDEGNPGGGGACGMMAGSCMSGVNVCRGGMIVCDGARGPSPEVCDGLDNDCNGMVDDGIADGGPCGSSMGRCMPGVSRCVMGRMVCEGGVGPRAEECNCQDDDCDGMVDETGEGGSALCGGGSVCAGAPSCGCLRPCADGEFPCPAGRTCQDVGGQRLCVGDPCAGVNCPSGQVCSNGACRSLCDGVTCDAPLVCDPRSGRCVSNDCRTLNNCASNELCIGGSCVMDRCAGVTCPGGQACYDGTCAPSCVGVTCMTGERCERGACVADPTTNRCATVTCGSNRVCDPSNGMCVVSRCGTSSTCVRGQTCNPLTGACVDDACATVRCPTGQECNAGQCRTSTTMTMNPPPTVTADRVISSGGGCAVPSNGGTSGLWMVGLALAAIASRRARRGERSAEVSR